VRKFFTAFTVLAVLGTVSTASLGFGPSASAHTGHTFSITDLTVTEGTGAGTTSASVTVTVNPAPQLNESLSVDWATSDAPVSAESGTDYTFSMGTATFTFPSVSETITVPITRDSVDEPDETFVVNLFNPEATCVVTCTTSASITDGQATVTIADDDTTSVAITNATAGEGNVGDTTPFDFTVTRNGGTVNEVKVDYVTADGTATAGSDHQLKSGTLTFPASDVTTSQTVSVNVLGDNIDEVNETFFVDLSNATNTTISDSQGLATINDDDGVPSFAIDDVTVLPEGDSGTTATFTVTRTGATERTTTVDYTTQNDTAVAPSDYASKSGTLTFAPGDPTETISVDVVGDTTDEPNETFNVNLSNAIDATVSDAQGVGTITDDDPSPSFAINDVTVTEGNSGTTPSTSATFTVTKTGATSQTTTVDFTTADDTATAPGDYTLQTNTLTFASGDTTKTITVAVNGDTIGEPNETLFVDLSNASINASTSDSHGIGTITDDERRVTIGDASAVEGSSVVFPVALSSPPGLSQSVTVNFDTEPVAGTATQGTDYPHASGSVTFGPGEISRNVSVPTAAFQDSVDEPEETFGVTLTKPTLCCTPDYVIGDSTGTGTINDDDESPSLTIDDVTVTEGDTGTTSRTFTVTKTGATVQTTTVDFATADDTATAPEDYTATSGTLTFAAGDTTKTISVDAVGDALDEPDETFFVNLTGPTNDTIADNQGQGTIQNDD
jgi:hypothetical protein